MINEKNSYSELKNEESEEAEANDERREESEEKSGSEMEEKGGGENYEGSEGEKEEDSYKGDSGEEGKWGEKDSYDSDYEGCANYQEEKTESEYEEEERGYSIDSEEIQRSAYLALYRLPGDGKAFPYRCPQMVQKTL